MPVTATLEVEAEAPKPPSDVAPTPAVAPAATPAMAAVEPPAKAPVLDVQGQPVAPARTSIPPEPIRPSRPPVRDEPIAAAAPPVEPPKPEPFVAPPIEAPRVAPSAPETPRPAPQPVDAFASTVTPGTSPLDFDEDSRPRPRAAPAPPSIARAPIASPSATTAKFEAREAAPSTPPKVVVKTSASRSSVVIGVSMVLASMIYTAGFMLRAPLMQLAFGHGAVVDHGGGSPPVTASSNAPQSPEHPTPLAAGASDRDAANTLADATVANAADAAAQSDASVAVAPAAVDAAAPTIAAHETPDAGAPAAANAHAPSPTPAAEDTGVAPSPAAGTTVVNAQPPHPRPTWHERIAVEGAIQRAINRCPQRTGRHARLHAIYDGATGQVSQIIWTGTAFDRQPVKPCVEAAIRGVAMQPFTEHDFDAEYVFPVH